MSRPLTELSLDTDCSTNPLAPRPSRNIQRTSLPPRRVNPRKSAPSPHRRFLARNLAPAEAEGSMSWRRRRRRTTPRPLGFRAERTNRLLELPGREVEVGLHLRGKVGVVLKVEPLRDNLQRKAFCDEASGQQHPMPSEELLGPQSGRSFDCIFQLPVGQFEMFGNSRDRKTLSLGKLQKVLPVWTYKTLSFPGNRKSGKILGHLTTRNLRTGKRGSRLQQPARHQAIT